MKLIRQIAVYLLLLALPFQAALAATGFACVDASHHQRLLDGGTGAQESGDDASVQRRSFISADGAFADSGTSHLPVHDACGACGSCCFAPVGRSPVAR